MSADHIGRALNGRRNASGWLVSCPCPNHGKGRGDRSPSLSVADGDEDRILLRCFAGCDFLEILDELRRLDLVDGECHNATRVRVENKPEPDAEAVGIWQ